MNEPTKDDFDSFDDLPDGAAADNSVQLPGPEDGLDIDIVDDTPERDRAARPLNKQVEEPTDEELAQYSNGVQRRIKDLTHARHDERRKREQIEREQQAALDTLRRVQSENQRLKQVLQDGSKQFSEMSVSSAEAKLEEARRKLREANEAFDIDKMTAAQEELADAKQLLREAKNFKPPVVQPDTDMVQTQPSQTGKAALDPKTEAWMSKNRWFTSPRHVAETSFALGLDKELRDSGYDPRTDEYFEQVDARMREHFPKLYSAKSAADDTPPQNNSSRERGSAVAPAVRTTSKRRVTLSASQVALCNKLGITPQQYAAELLAAGELK